MAAAIAPEPAFLRAGFFHDPLTVVDPEVAGMLKRWASDVPLASAAEAMCNEHAPRCRPAQEKLLKAIVQAQAETTNSQTGG